MKRFYLILTVLMIALFSACAAGGEGASPLLFSTPSPTPTATPIPTPQPAIAVLADAEHALFYDGLTADPPGDNARLVRLDNGLAALGGPDFQGAHTLIAYLDGSTEQREALEELAAAGTPVCAYAPHGETAPTGIPTLLYDAAGAAEKALDEAILYDPHDTPVRLTAMLVSEQSAAFSVFSEGIASGKVLRKGVYIENVTEMPAAEWISSRMAATLPGTVDGVYAETAELALLAADAIQASGLAGIEVFSAEVSEELLIRMLTDPAIVAVAVGTNDAYAGRYLRAQATRQLLLLPNVSDGAQLLPRLYRASTLEDDWPKLPEG